MASEETAREDEIVYLARAIELPSTSAEPDHIIHP